MEWISVDERFPTKERLYRCLCLGFNKIIKCKFQKEKNGPIEWSPSLFIHRKRIPFVRYWYER